MLKYYRLAVYSIHPVYQTEVSKLASKKSIIYITIEDYFSKNTWYSQIWKGICKEVRKTEELVICTKEELLHLPSGSLVILLGASSLFIEECVNICTQVSLHPIIAGFELRHPSIEASYITINRSLAMTDIVKTLISFGAKHIALLGINSAVNTDMLRYIGWYSTVTAFHVADPESDVYYSDHGIEECMEKFWDNAHKYDAVACTNDYYAVYLLAHASEHHIRVPEDLMITGFGNTGISQYTTPPLTTVAMNFFSIGVQTVLLYRLLSNQSDLHSCTEILKANIICRGTTNNTPVTVIPESIVHSKEISSIFNPDYEDYFQKLYAVEDTLKLIDETDKKILQGLLKNIPYASLAEELFLSDTAFKYRLNKLFAATHCKNKTELIRFFQQYIPLFSYSQDS